ncbi:MAG: LysR family transcriptional regulator [Eubacterium sp.]|nr:LysR family transcriptional regulator [Eubacterium sp.]
MTQKQLTYFVTVYEQKSISKAAKMLYITPQALSKSLASLEEELQISLFTHTSNRIVPTEEAARLVNHARNIILEYDIVENRLFKQSNIRHPLPISCTYDSLQVMSSEFFHSFMVEHPNILLQLREYPDQHILKQLDHNQVDLAFLPGPLDYDKYEYTPIFSDDFRLILPKNHRLAIRDYIDIEDLKDEPLVIKSGDSTTSISQYSTFIDHGILPNIILETSDNYLLMDLIARGQALGMALGFFASKISHPEVVTKPFHNVKMSKTIYLTQKKDFPLSHEARHFKEDLLDYIYRL